MTSVAAQLPPVVTRYVRSFRARWIVQSLLAACGFAMFLMLLVAIAFCLTDRVVALPRNVRLIALITNLLIGLGVVAFGVTRSLRKATARAAAGEIERREPALAERLYTLVSRASGPPQYVGSPELFDVLAQQVADDLRDRDPGDILPWGAALWTWLASGVTLVAFATLATLPVLDVPRLLQRYAVPLADVAPAATTRLFVFASPSVPQGGTLRVRATAQRLSTGTLTLHVRQAGGTWTEQPMTAEADGMFESGVQGVERDLEYFVTGGDARSDTFRVNVLRRPAIVAVRAMLVGASDNELPVTNAAIEVPAESEAIVSVEASEPLSSATLLIGGESIDTQPTTRPTIRQARVLVRDDRRFMIRLRSAAGVDGFFRGGMLRAIPPDMISSKPSAATATSHPAALPDAIPWIPSGYDAALKAYFNAIRRPSADR